MVGSGEAGASPVRIRRARREDAARIRAVHVGAVHALCREDYTPAQIAAWTGSEPESYALRVDNPDCAFLVAERAGEVVGFAAQLAGELLSLYVAPGHARRGVGSALLAAAEEAARAQGFRALSLNSSLTAVEFYRRRGYTELGPGEFRMESGVEIPCVRMRKRWPMPGP